jgi:hypothetical protein
LKLFTFASLLLSLIPLCAGARTTHNLPLKRGVYIEADVPCEHPATVYTYGYYGDSFAVGHNGCQFHTLKRKGHVIRSLLECSDLPSGDGMSLDAIFTIQDATHFNFATRMDPRSKFSGTDVRWCAASIDELL